MHAVGFREEPNDMSSTQRRDTYGGNTPQPRARSSERARASARPADDARQPRQSAVGRPQAVARPPRQSASARQPRQSRQQYQPRSAHQRACVLMHDSEGKGTTVEALPQVIDGLREQGYIFGVLTPDTYPFHHIAL